LIAEPEAAADALERLWKEWDDGGRHESLQTLRFAIGEQVRSDHLQPAAWARALVCYGWIREGNMPVRETEPLAREALVLFRELAHEPGQCDAHDLLGDTLETEGDLAGALGEFREYKRIMLALTGWDPDNAQWQEDLEATKGWVAQLRSKVGRE